jgi:hypothetical protein
MTAHDKDTTFFPPIPTSNRIDLQITDPRITQLISLLDEPQRVFIGQLMESLADAKTLQPLHQETTEKFADDWTDLAIELGVPTSQQLSIGGLKDIEDANGWRFYFDVMKIARAAAAEGVMNPETAAPADIFLILVHDILAEMEPYLDIIIQAANTQASMITAVEQMEVKLTELGQEKTIGRLVRATFDLAYFKWGYAPAIEVSKQAKWAADEFTRLADQKLGTQADSFEKIS